MGPFSVKLARVPEERCRPAPALDELRRSGAGFIAGSALFHAAVFAAIALFARSLGATEEDPFDADRMALLQRMLDASAQREAEAVHPPEDAASPAGGGDVSAGQPARGAEGVAGRPDTTKSGRWAAKGAAKPEDATLAREHDLVEAQTFAAIGVLSAAFASDPNAPVAAWGTVLNGSDAESRSANSSGTRSTTVEAPEASASAESARAAGECRTRSVSMASTGWATARGRAMAPLRALDPVTVMGTARAASDRPGFDGTPSLV